MGTALIIWLLVLAPSSEVRTEVVILPMSSYEACNAAARAMPDFKPERYGRVTPTFFITQAMCVEGVREGQQK